MQHAGGALNLSVLSKGLEARFLMCVMSLSHFCWLLCEDHGPEVEHITWNGAFRFLQTHLSSAVTAKGDGLATIFEDVTWEGCGL